MYDNGGGEKFKIPSPPPFLLPPPPPRGGRFTMFKIRPLNVILVEYEIIINVDI